MRRFLNGIFIGSLMGTMFGIMANGNMKPQRKRILGKTRRMSKDASKMVNDVTKSVSRMIKHR